jgi:hypothetical protein
VEIALLEADSETRSDAYAVHAFLKQNQWLAYSAAEVATAIRQEPGLVEHILNKFDDLELVEMLFSEDEWYFRLKEDIPQVDGVLLDRTFANRFAPDRIGPMATNPEEFRILQNTLRQSVLEYFKQNRFSAFTAEEAAFELAILGVMTTSELVEAELTRWTEERRLFSGLRDGEVYYWYDNRLGFQSSR